VTSFWTALYWLMACVAGWWCLALLYALLNRLLLPRLPRECLPDLPSLSVVVPARDEELALEEALRSHLVQDYPGLQVVVCDDGSTDRTPEILARLQAEFPHLTVVRGGELRAGWLGKPNAQRQAYERATGEVLLFVDADVRYGPGLHRRAVSELVRRRADMLLLLGTLEGRGLEPLILSFLDAFVGYSFPAFLVNAPRPRWMAFGAGSGNLVRRDALEASGGLEALRAEVVDDVAMGRQLKRYRGRFRLALASGELRVRMYPSFAAAFRGFTKNLYSAFGRRLWFGIPSFVADLAVHTLPAALVSLSWALPALEPLRPLAAFSVAAGAACNGAVALWAGQPLWVALAFPLRTPLWFVMFLKSAWVYHRRGIVWRGRVFRG